MITSLFACLCYWAAIGLLLAPARLAGFALLPGLLALAAHAMLLFGQGIGFRFFDALSWVSFAMALLAAPGLLRPRLRPLALGSFAVAALGCLLPGLGSGPAPRVLGWQIELHAAMALSAYAALSLATLQALLVWHQESSLRRHRTPLHGWLALPPLSVTEQLLFRWILTGFALLSLTLLSGALFIRDWFSQHLVHKTVLTLLAWGVFGALLLGHWRAGWRGRQAARWTLTGMSLLLLAFFGSKYVLELVLQRA